MIVTARPHNKDRSFCCHKSHLYYKQFLMFMSLFTRSQCN